MTTLETAMTGDDYLAIRHGIEALDIATKPFAQARMNRAIDASFRGKTLDEVEATVAHAHGLDAAHDLFYSANPRLLGRIRVTAHERSQRHQRRHVEADIDVAQVQKTADEQ